MIQECVLGSSLVFKLIEDYLDYLSTELIIMYNYSIGF